MGPDRSKPPRRQGSHHSGAADGNAEAGPSRFTPAGGPGATKAKVLPIEKRDPGGVPGISKLKASIRQTKRFLAKDTLEPALRISTERRLVSLEADLATAQRREVEKKNGARYHQVKFFEKRKLLRIIKRAKKALAEAEAESDSDGKGKKKMEKELSEARVMLNYVRHYPNTQKYIGLFPSAQDEDDTATSLKLPKLFKKPKSKSKTEVGVVEDEDESTTKRRQMLDRIKGMMDDGSLPAEPELVVGSDQPLAGAGAGAGAELGLGSGGAKEAKATSKKKKQEQKEAEAEDDFFDVDGDE